MTGQEFKIVFLKDKAYLTKDKQMAFEQLGMPEIAKTFKVPAFWTIRVLKYIKPEQRLFVEILTYEVGETNYTIFQKHIAEQLDEIKKITFKAINTNGLLMTLNGNTKTVYNHPKEEMLFVQEKHILTIGSFPPSNNTYIVPEKREPIKRVISETFFISLKNVNFKLGCVSLDKKFKDYDKSLELTIFNYDIREEFDAVKNYFSNVLNTKKITVTAIIEITDNKITSQSVTSPEIFKINKALIDSVKFQFIRTIIKKKISAEIDKNLFTMDEYFETFAEDKFKPNTFYKNDKELFEDLLSISKTKHYRHLRFLSSKHAHQIMKLRFVHKPFSFIFLMEGERNYHIIWETLDTEEATYIWHIEKNLNILKMTLRKLEDVINVIKIEGKTAYINSNDAPLRRIYHDYSELIDGFVKWKGELESVLA